jgi:hypothetical protein
MIKPEAIFAYKPKPVLIRIKETQEEVKARPCSNGWWHGAGVFVHTSAAKLVKVLENE